MREHGKRLNFLAVILERLNFPTEDGKYVAATATAKMAQLLGADDVIITWHCFGNPFVDTMLTVQACTRRGIKTVLITPEHGGTEGTDLPLVFSVPEAIAMVSTGGADRRIELPVPAKVIGVDRGQLVRLFPGDPPFDPWKERKTQAGWSEILGGVDWFGGMNLTCEAY
jgi:glycine reductase